jgi:hypothetical protein
VYGHEGGSCATPCAPQRDDHEQFLPTWRFLAICYLSQFLTCFLWSEAMESEPRSLFKYFLSVSFFLFKIDGPSHLRKFESDGLDHHSRVLFTFRQVSDQRKEKKLEKSYLTSFRTRFGFVILPVPVPGLVQMMWFLLGFLLGFIGSTLDTM